jgi:hypothetical protein
MMDTVRPLGSLEDISSSPPDDDEYTVCPSPYVSHVSFLTWLVQKKLGGKFPISCLPYFMSVHINNLVLRVGSALRKLKNYFIPCLSVSTKNCFRTAPGWGVCVCVCVCVVVDLVLLTFRPVSRGIFDLATRDETSSRVCLDYTIPCSFCPHWLVFLLHLLLFLMFGCGRYQCAFSMLSFSFCLSVCLSVCLFPLLSSFCLI